MKKIAIPWIEGGKDLVQNMANGFKDLHDFQGAEGFRDEVGNVVAAFGLQVSEMATGDCPEKFIYGIATILKITDNIEDYENEIAAQKFKAKAETTNYN